VIEEFKKRRGGDEEEEEEKTQTRCCCFDRENLPWFLFTPQKLVKGKM
jgi:hypothetical protein